MENLIKVIQYTTIGRKTTICLLTLYNGFEVAGVSSCVDRADFNKEIGQRKALEDAKRNLNQLVGFMKQQKMHLRLEDLPF